MACGAEFTMWLTREGRLLSAGCPQHGQLGHGTDHEYNAKDCARPEPSHLDPSPTHSIAAPFSAHASLNIDCHTDLLRASAWRPLLADLRRVHWQPEV